MIRNVVELNRYIWRPFVSWLFSVMFKEVSYHRNVTHRTVHVPHTY